MNKFKAYLDSKRPAKPTQSKVEAYIPTPKEELATAWKEWKETFRLPILIGKGVFWCIVILTTLRATAVVMDWNEFHKSKEYKQWKNK